MQINMNTLSLLAKCDVAVDFNGLCEVEYFSV